MDEAFYIILTVVFALFVLFMIWWFYQYVSTPTILSMKEDDLSDREKDVIYKFCSEMRKSRLKQEKNDSTNKKIKKVKNE
jgi:hypothetical protein